MREMTVREANQNFFQVIAAVERGETIVITKNGTPVAKIAPQPADRTNDPEWGSAFAALKEEPAVKTSDRLSGRNDHGRQQVRRRRPAAGLGLNHPLRPLHVMAGLVPAIHALLTT